MDSSPEARRRALLALLLLVPVPSLAVWVAGSAAPGQVGQVFFAAAKAWVLLLPVVWTVLVDRRRLTIPRPRMRGMPAAVATGSVILVAIVVAYLLLGRHWIDVESMRQKASEFGLTPRGRYVLLALYWIGINSLLEEYIWRWFVFTRCETLMPRAAAVLASAAFFTAHHIIALEIYFDWRVSILGSLGVLIGGATWSWIYLTYRNIWAAYVSHVFADVAVFAIGWMVIFG